MIQNSSWRVSFNEAYMWQCIYGCNFIQNYDKRIVFQIEKSKKKMSFLDIFTISPLQRPREISQNVSGLYYVRRGAGYKIHICAKLCYLGRAKVFSSVATDFGSWTLDWPKSWNMTIRIFFVTPQNLCHRIMIRYCN